MLGETKQQQTKKLRIFRMLIMPELAGKCSMINYTNLTIADFELIS